ncbi:MAG: toll/interleukin-1 receptor domain-containing protein, partial [Chloroflexota bacterium]|nr:toll/interleukin-1 receptor domain-containing protein [Chloroflexota bacterium]
MKVFLSFSGERSRAVAEAFRDGLRPVIQAVDPYISSRDIDKGARWAEEITQQLEASHFGIIFVTSDNLDAKWLHFEAGALSKSLERGRVAPFLFGVEQEQLHGPLTMFQSTRNTAEDIRALVQTINSFSEQPLAETDLSQIFNVWWPRLQKNLECIARNPDLQPHGPAPRVDPREV